MNNDNNEIAATNANCKQRLVIWHTRKPPNDVLKIVWTDDWTGGREHKAKRLDYKKPIKVRGRKGVFKTWRWVDAENIPLTAKQVPEKWRDI